MYINRSGGGGYGELQPNGKSLAQQLLRGRMPASPRSVLAGIRQFSRRADCNLGAR
jgi:hypothetical protein